MGLASAKDYFLENSFNLKPLSLLHVEGYIVSKWKGLDAKKSLGGEKYWNVFSFLQENFSGTGFISFTLLRFLLVLFLLRLCFGPYPNQKFLEMVFRMKASTHIYYFLQMSERLRLGCQNVPSKKADLATLLVAVVGSLNPKLYQDGCISCPFPLPPLLKSNLQY